MFRVMLINNKGYWDSFQRIDICDLPYFLEKSPHPPPPSNLSREAPSLHFLMKGHKYLCLNMFSFDSYFFKINVFFFLQSRFNKMRNNTPLPCPSPRSPPPPPTPFLAHGSGLVYILFKFHPLTEWTSSPESCMEASNFTKFRFVYCMHN